MLGILGRAHDLPPLWDGHVAVWEEWHMPPLGFDCPPRAEECCPGCGGTHQRVHAEGRIATSPATRVTREMIAERDRAREQGLPGWQQMPGEALCVLTAFRCPQCFTDEVWDRRAGVTWLLDESDYTAEGSRAPVA